MMKRSYILSIIILVLSSIFALKLEVRSDVIVQEKRLDLLPRTIGEYHARDISISDSVVRELDTDVYIFRDYMSPDGESITLYVGYYGTMKGGRSEHTPEGCYPGSGWAILKEEKSELLVPYKGAGRKIVLNRLLVSKGDTKQVVYHWYQSDRDKVISTGIQMNINRFLSRLLYNRNDGAFVRVSSAVTNDQERTRYLLDRFIRSIYPLIAEYWPREKDA